MKKIFDNNKYFSLKLSYFNIGILSELENGNDIINKNKPLDPLLNLSKDIEEIKNILKFNPQDILYYLYFNIGNIERILYKKDEIIYFDFDDKNNNYFLKINQEKIEIKKKNEMFFLFYLCLLIKYNQNIVNFSFSIHLINKIEIISKNNDASTLFKNVLISKIILELITFYKSTQILEEKINKDEIEKLNEIEKECKYIIENHINNFENIGLKISQKELELKNIDLIYATIINILLKSQDYNMVYKIIEQLDLENIIITKTMFNEIYKNLSSNYNFIEGYRLSTFDDFLNPKKIDFYYILFKYIFKNQIYIYYIDFLNETRKTIIKILHLNQNQLKYLSKNENCKIYNIYKDKIIYIIKFITNSDYYANYINLENSNTLNSKSSEYSETNPYSSKPSDNSSFKTENEKSISKDQIADQSKYSKTSVDNISNYEGITKNPLESSSYVKRQKEDSYERNQNEETVSINENVDEEEDFKNIINFIEKIIKKCEITLNINNKKESKENKENNEIIIEYDTILYSKDNGKTYKKFKNIFTEEYKQICKKDDYLNKYLEIYNRLIDYLEKIKEIAKNTFSKINDKLLIKIFLEEEDTKNNNNIKTINSKYSLGDSSILKKEYQDKNILNISSYKDFESFLKEIVDFYQPRTQNKNKNSIFNNISSIDKKSNNMGTSTFNNAKKITTSINEKYHFIYFIKVIGKHKKAAEKIREIKDINGGYFVSDGYNEIFKYNMDYKLDDNDKNFEKYYSFFVEENDVIISQKKKFSFLNKLNGNQANIKINFSCRNLFKLKENKYIICDENGLYYCMNGLSGINSSYEISKVSYRGGIVIADDIIAVTSNIILLKGENKLAFFNTTSKGFMTEIGVEDYSFTISENNCALMSIPNNDNCKLLLFACKKYKKSDKNGILLLKLQFSKDNKKFIKFYDTKNFEVYCFCPILNIENITVLGNNDKTQAGETEYFFVGGFELDKNEGLIKLYKIIYDNEIEKIEIEYIQDIIVEKKIRKDSNSFKGFKGLISCITQSSGGEILVTCYDGNVYLFSKPNITLLNSDYNNILK